MDHSDMNTNQEAMSLSLLVNIMFKIIQIFHHLDAINSANPFRFLFNPVENHFHPLQPSEWLKNRISETVEQCKQGMLSIYKKHLQDKLRECLGKLAPHPGGLLAFRKAKILAFANHNFGDKILMATLNLAEKTIMELMGPQDPNFKFADLYTPDHLLNNTLDPMNIAFCCIINFGNRIFYSVEHYYHYYKAIHHQNHHLAAKISKCRSPAEARKLSIAYFKSADFIRSLQKSPHRARQHHDWTTKTKMEVMWKGHILKFAQVHTFREALRTCGTAPIVVPTSDPFWGAPGKNMLGMILMRLRGERFKLWPRYLRHKTSQELTSHMTKNAQTQDFSNTAPTTGKGGPIKSSKPLNQHNTHHTNTAPTPFQLHDHSWPKNTTHKPQTPNKHRLSLSPTSAAQTPNKRRNTRQSLPSIKDQPPILPSIRPIGIVTTNNLDPTSNSDPIPLPEAYQILPSTPPIPHYHLVQTGSLETPRTKTKRRLPFSPEDQGVAEPPSSKQDRKLSPIPLLLTPLIDVTTPPNQDQPESRPPSPQPPASQPNYDSLEKESPDPVLTTHSPEAKRNPIFLFESPDSPAPPTPTDEDPSTPTFCNPIHQHPSQSTTGKMEKWAPPPSDTNAHTLIIGDSNLNRITSVDTNHTPKTLWHSYPGAQFKHLSAILRKYPQPQIKIKHVITNIGINNKGQNLYTTAKKDMDTLISKMKVVFPNATIFFQTIQHGPDLLTHEKLNMDTFNRYLASKPGITVIPPLPDAEFLPDHIHWENNTANRLASHWMNFLA